MGKPPAPSVTLPQLASKTMKTSILSSTYHKAHQPSNSPPPPKPKTPTLGKVQVLYNHYHEFFPIRDGILFGADIDDKYSFSFVFKGNFQSSSSTQKQKYIPKLDNSRWDFANIIDGKVYQRLDARPVGSYGYKAAKPLKGMTQEQLMEKARELEDALYS
ncbi:hypothetical protein BCR33DRAFT_718371 [Rhizoclosmatium globosum]|uniref:Uncharacterized protein n=1 Tax=Rhizoclosmatium globosum TaxID=329046 RepID=A0A1Y2C572_9FUNG|nr:hypothetical protein BCR33DRAFT_718371 [Rhizoclosmatium globosum]|eukprot:ORY42171.1 hypothetical protein BCR33DRAFT_718371 [Rhizoclosmatium globosum]